MRNLLSDGQPGPEGTRVRCPPAGAGPPPPSTSSVNRQCHPRARPDWPARSRGGARRPHRDCGSGASCWPSLAAVALVAPGGPPAGTEAIDWQPTGSPGREQGSGVSARERTSPRREPVWVASSGRVRPAPPPVLARTGRPGICRAGPALPNPSRSASTGPGPFPLAGPLGSFRANPRRLRFASSGGARSADARPAGKPLRGVRGNARHPGRSRSGSPAPDEFGQRLRQLGSKSAGLEFPRRTSSPQPESFSKHRDRPHSAR